MPWDCKSCGHHVDSDSSSACPSCHTAKTEWSVVGDHTRQIVITRARFECLRGRDLPPSPATAPLYDPAALDATTEARVVRKAVALALASDGRQPPSRDILVVRLHPRADTGHVTLGIDFAAASAQEKSYLVPTRPIDIPFLFVAGPEALPEGFGFPGLHVVDVTEEGEPGYAPTVQVTALKQPSVELTTVPAEPPITVHRLAATPLRFVQGSGLAMPRQELPHHPLLALVVAAGFLADHPEHRLLLVGHASPEGGEKHNAKLALARAEGLAQLVRGERDAWVETATDHGSLGDIKAYLSYLARERGWSCDPGPVTPANDAAAKAGVEAFQREFNQRFQGGLDEDGVCGKATLGAVFDVLSFELDRWLEKHGLTRQALRLAQPAALGAGEALTTHPALPQPATDENRRIVDLLLLPPEVEAVEDPAALYDDGAVTFAELPIDPEPGAWEVGSLTIVTDLLPADISLGERYRLTADDGSFDVERAVPEHGVVRGGGIELDYEGVPTRPRFTLTVTSAEGKVSTPFKDVPYGAFHGLSTALPAQPPFIPT